MSDSYSPGDVANGHVLGADGQWTPVAETPPVAPAAPLVAPEPPKKKHTGLKVFGAIVVVLLVLGVISAALGGNKSNGAAAGATTTPSTATSPTDTPTPTVEPPTPTPTQTAPVVPVAPAMTVSQENAVKSAQSYLDMTGFSRTGLIEQLSSSSGEGFPKADAVFAVDYLHVNWNEQAVKAGQSYLDMSGFSRSGLIEQLSSKAGDGFTKAQATYAANKLGL
jgi:hypothetical protein